MTNPSANAELKLHRDYTRPRRDIALTHLKLLLNEP